MRTLGALCLVLCGLVVPAVAQEEGGSADLVNEPAIEFEGVDLDGNIVRLSDLTGKVVLINFWGVWCISCRQEIPELVALDRQWRDRGWH